MPSSIIVIYAIAFISLALAAYNAGERAVASHGGIPPYDETKTYIGRVLRHYEIFKRESQ